MTGLWRCAKYAFAPNYLKYCGPDKNKELAGYLTSKTTDLGLEQMLKKFAAMHPYLKLIARQNGIADAFDRRVVEAYWLGNDLLDGVTMKGFFEHAKTRLPAKEHQWFELKLPQGAKPNHNFHVFNFIKRTGHQAVNHTVETMDYCRISSGCILAGGKVKTDKLIYQKGRLKLTPAVKKFHNLVDGFKPGDLVTLHWGFLCEKINRRQANSLARYTRLALNLANQTI